MNIHQIRKHFSVTSCLDMQELCQPLAEIDISLFVYARIYPDGKRLFLSNNSTWNETYIDKLYKKVYVDNYQFEASVNQNLLLIPEMFPGNVAFGDAREMFGFKYAYLITNHYENYKEICYFVTNEYDPYVFNTFRINLDVLSKFNAYFNEKAKKLIHTGEKNKLEFSVIEGSSGHSNSVDTNEKYRLLESQLTQQIKFYKPGLINSYLTHRELECIRWLIVGKTAEETGLILGISKRTVEKYIEKLKNKYNCTKLTQLIYKLAKANLDIYL